MDFMQDMVERARQRPMCVAFPEGEDEAMMGAAAECARNGMARPVLVGDESSLRALCAERGIDAGLFAFADVKDTALVDSVVARWLALPGRMMGEKTLRSCLADPLYLACALQAVGDADVAFAGITASTGDVIMAGQVMVGLAPGIDTPSSVAVFDVPGFEGPEGSLLAFGDSAVCVNPTAEELASIAIACCDTVHDLMGWDPRCALLSHSTCGSADNELSEKVVSAVAVAQQRRPDLAIDGEFQLDAALSPRVAARKVKRNSAVAGRANIVVWPDLDVGNITVKAAQLFAGAKAYGPFLQGFAGVVSDCSRGASTEEIIGNVAVSCVRAAALNDRKGTE